MVLYLSQVASRRQEQFQLDRRGQLCILALRTLAESYTIAREERAFRQKFSDADTPISRTKRICTQTSLTQPKN